MRGCICLRETSLTESRTDGLKKTDLELELENELQNNPTKYADNEKYAGYYVKRRSEGSPVKKENAMSMALDTIETKAKTVRRRATKAADEVLAM
jgi:hypothetical protein